MEQPLIDKNTQSPNHVPVKKNGSLNNEDNGSDGDETDSQNGNTVDKVSLLS